MSLDDAKRSLRRSRALDALRESGTDAEDIAEFESAISAGDMVMTAVHMLLARADATAARNYISMQMTGLPAPWDRAFIELVRPGGKYSSELVDELRGSLDTAIMLLTGPPSPDLVAAFVSRIRERHFPDQVKTEPPP